MSDSFLQVFIVPAIIAIFVLSFFAFCKIALKSRGLAIILSFLNAIFTAATYLYCFFTNVGSHKAFRVSWLQFITCLVLGIVFFAFVSLISNQKHRNICEQIAKGFLLAAGFAVLISIPSCVALTLYKGDLFDSNVGF